MSRNDRAVKIDAFPESAFRYLEYDAIVCIDVIRATTTLVTGVAQGRRCHPFATPEAALAFAARGGDVLLAGERGGNMPAGFEMQNSPARLALRRDVRRPLALVSSSGTELILNASGCPAAYVACLRNMSATVEALARRHRRVVLLGAGSRGEFRCEDQLAAAWIAGRLVERGFAVECQETLGLIERWSEAELRLIGWGKSAEYLRRSGQEEDLQFILAHVDDVDAACVYRDGAVVALDAVREPEPVLAGEPEAAEAALGGGV